MTDFACSVVIPSFNHRRYVGAAIESVLAQTLQPIEIVVIDDGSDDGSVAFIRERFGDAVHVLETRPNRGAADTINEGIARASAATVAILNSDDVHAPERLQRIVPWMDRIAADVVFSSVRLVDEAGNADESATAASYRRACSDAAAEDWRGAMVETNLALTSSSIVARKAAVAAVGGFRPFRYVHDWDFLLRCLGTLQVEWLPEALCDYRLHGANTIGEVREGSGKALMVAEQSLMAALFLSEAAGTKMAGRRDRLLRAPDLRIATTAALASRIDRDGPADALAALRSGRLAGFVDDAIAGSLLAPLRFVSVSAIRTARRPAFSDPRAHAPAPAGVRHQRRKALSIEMMRGVLRLQRTIRKHVLRREIASYDSADFYLKCASEAIGRERAHAPQPAAPARAPSAPTIAGIAPSAPLRRIVLVSHVGYRGGASLILLSLARRLRRDFGLEVFSILADDGAIVEDFKAEGRAVVWAGTAPFPGPIHSLPKPPEVDALAARLKAQLPAAWLAGGSTVAICNTILTARYASAFRRIGIPVLSLIHERATSFPAAHLDEIYAAAARIVYPAQLMHDAAARRPGFDPARSLILPQDLVTDGFGALDPARARADVLGELGLPETARIVLGCGPADMRKGFDHFVATLLTVRDAARRHDLVFVWLGQNVPTSIDVQAWLARDLDAAGLRDRLRMVAHTHFPEPFFHAADVFLLTSREDPFPCAAQEALACRAPVICFRDATGTQELLDQGLGVVVPYGDVAGMGAALLALIEDDGKRRAIGETGRRFVLDRYARGAYARGIHDLASTLLHASPT